MCQHWPATKHGCGCPSTRATVLRCHLAWPLGKPCPAPPPPPPTLIPLPPSPPKRKDSVLEPERQREREETKCWACQTEGNTSSLATGFHTLDVTRGIGWEYPKSGGEKRERRRLWANESAKLEARMPKLPWEKREREEEVVLLNAPHASDVREPPEMRDEDDGSSLDNGWDDCIYAERKAEGTWPKKATTKPRPDDRPEDHSNLGSLAGTEHYTEPTDTFFPLEEPVISTPETLRILEEYTTATSPSLGPSASISRRASAACWEASLRFEGALPPPLYLGPPALSPGSSMFQPRSRIEQTFEHQSLDASVLSQQGSPVPYEDHFPWATVSPRAVRPGTLSDVDMATEPFPAF